MAKFCKHWRIYIHSLLSCFGREEIKSNLFFSKCNSLAPRYQSIERCKGHWRKSCVTKREDLTTLVYIVATRKREGELRSNFFCFSLFRATSFVIRDAISFVSPLTTSNLSPQRAITYAKKPKSNDQFKLIRGIYQPKPTSNRLSNLLSLCFRKNEKRVENAKSIAIHEKFIMT